jgi:hypothetical protein
MHKRGSIIKIFALLIGLLTLSAMSSCPDDSSRGQSGDANQSGSEIQGGNAGEGMGGDSGGGGGGY